MTNHPQTTRKTVDGFKISVAMCTYNGAPYISEQLDSIFNQSRQPDEIIICDDGSTDGTTGIIREQIRNHPGIVIRLVQNETNLGYVRNFEKAAGLCTGDIVFLSDQDDVWYPARIEYMIKPFIGESGIGLVYSDAVIVDEDLNPLDATVFSTRINAQLRKGQKRRIAEVVLNPDIKGCMMAFRSDLRRVFFPIPPNAEKLGWGHDHWFAGIAFAVTGVHVIDRALMSYRRHGKNFGRDVLSTTRFPLLKKISISVRSKMSPKKPPEHTPDMIVARLELMLDRLQMIRSDHIGMIRSMAAINEYIGTHREAIEAIRLRGGMRGMGVLNRVSVACRLLRKGWYGKYFSGMISFFKDVLSG